ncbi:MAG: hypothetical protein EAZ47_05375 [Bacteroidetes bacterium]|nr:MAG: hypothetical protein EAY72_08540 [Bacteroidota bacterium]TAE69620.1 MAG: hypothetical protein EAY68_03505 [Bacteroidota bacterium]TAF93887.1 MAG: hypothetical protein EAZ47_05375 [Bacteroidota bacterium]
MNNKIEIAQLALENLQKNVGIHGTCKPSEHTDFDCQVTVTINNQTVNFNAAVKQELRHHQLTKIFSQASENNPLIVIANHIFPKIKDELRNNAVAYLETNGNIFVKHKELLLWVDAQKPLQQLQIKTNRAFSKTGLKVLYHLLQDDIVNWSYREIAALAGVGLGNVNYVFNGLKEFKFLIKINKSEYKLQNKKELLDKWIVGYAEKLKPTLFVGSFRFLNPRDFEQWRDVKFHSPTTTWGGEAAGSLLTNYLTPEVLTIYTNETRNELIRKYKLIPDEEGDIKIYKRFWNNNYDDSTESPNIVPPLLAYADLISTDDSRCVETAEKIYQTFIRDEFIKN